MKSKFLHHKEHRILRPVKSFWKRMQQWVKIVCEDYYDSCEVEEEYKSVLGGESILVLQQDKAAVEIGDQEIEINNYKSNSTASVYS